ncbi:MAG: hypothetical protein N4A72_05165 [Bacteroidales bacterium]|nr:hypothetical protein [Bacteroidales bacterium]
MTLCLLLISCNEHNGSEENKTFLKEVDRIDKDELELIDVIYNNRLRSSDLEIYYDYKSNEEYYDSLIRISFKSDSNIESKLSGAKERVDNYISSRINEVKNEYYNSDVLPGGEEFYNLFELEDTVFLNFLLKVLEEHDYKDYDGIIKDFLEYYPNLLPDSVRYDSVFCCDVACNVATKNRPGFAESNGSVF